MLAWFGVPNPQGTLFWAGAVTDAIGSTHLTYVQTYQGVPVYGWVLQLHLASDGRVSIVRHAGAEHRGERHAVRVT